MALPRTVCSCFISNLRELRLRGRGQGHVRSLGAVEILPELSQQALCMALGQRRIDIDPVTTRHVADVSLAELGQGAHSVGELGRMRAREDAAKQWRDREESGIHRVE